MKSGITFTDLRTPDQIAADLIWHREWAMNLMMVQAHREIDAVLLAEYEQAAEWRRRAAIKPDGYSRVLGLIGRAQS